MSAAGRRAHRPVRYADLTGLIDAAGGTHQPTRGEIAAATASVVIAAGRRESTADGAGPSPEWLVGLADVVGIDTLAALWRDAEPDSLPGALWTLYLLRQWCRTQSDEVTRLWRGGEPYAPADAVVAGVGMHGDRDAIRGLADAILAGAYVGDFAVALERAAAFFRVVAAGRREVSPDQADAELAMAARNERAARDLASAARAWRAGILH